MARLLTIVLLLTAQLCYSQDFYLFVGTYTTGEGKGIYVYKFNAESGALTPASIAEGVENPSFLTVSPNGNYVYAVNQHRGEKPSTVSAFKFDHSTGKLQYLNKQPSGGDGPCYVSIDNTGSWVMVGNYTAGTLAAIKVNGDGSLDNNLQFITHKGKSVHPTRQDKPHVHAVRFASDNKYLFVPDLGTDRVVAYKFNAKAEKNPLEEMKKYVAATPGSGPRHITFHPKKPYAYLIEEMHGMVSGYKYKKGQLEPIQRISSHPLQFRGDTSSADIHVSPDGNFLYASNRGSANSIAIFSLNQKNGKLEWKGVESAGGTTPRNFMIDPTGNYLLVANQNSSNVVVFKRDQKTGLLTKTSELKVPNPVCLKMVARK